MPPRLAVAQSEHPRIFSEIRRGDISVHQPYESFRGSFEVFAQAAVEDPNVIAMKTAVYRTSDDSALVGSLIECAEDGKQSVCLVELKARFDERRNIEWSRALEQAGVHVVYGFPDLKIHAKMTLIVRREGKALRRYAHIGTGNYHAATARLYEDFGIFTADEDIAADVADLFNYITGFGKPRRFRKLLVAPFTLRSGLVEEIRAVAAAAAKGKPARIRLKVNHLVDAGIVDELYAASQAGASIDVLARSTCSLRPGSRASPRTSGSARSSAASSSTAASTPSRPATRRRRTSAAPTSCRATSTTGSRCWSRSRTRASGRTSTPSSTARSRTTRTPGCSPRTGRGRGRPRARSRTRTTRR